MSEVSEYKAARSELTRAEQALERERQRLAEMWPAIASAEADLEAIRKREKEVFVGSGEVNSKQAALEECERDRETTTRRIEQYRRLFEHQEENVARRVTELLEAERRTQAAQRSYFHSAYQKKLEQVWLTVKEHLRELLILASADAYHSALSRGEQDATRAWNGMHFDSLIDGEFLSFIQDKLLIEGNELAEGIVIDRHPKGSPPIRAERCNRLSDEERRAAEEMAKGVGRAVDKTVDWMQGSRVADDRYRPGEMIRYWTEKVSELESRVAYLNTAEFLDRNLTPSEALRKAALEEPTRALERAKEVLANWQRSADRQSATAA